MDRSQDILNIMQLKAAYLNACDLKDTQKMRTCFLEGDVLIDYGVVGTFTNREGLIDVFNQMGNHPHLCDLHLGGNPEIHIVSDAVATGFWSLNFRQINQKDKIITTILGYYEDEYRKVDGDWKIAKTVFKARITTVEPMSDQAKLFG